ncbi:MAG: bacteriophage holin [Alphaproteobacteria bacterium]|nr:bacteriophage holin [Alphaproteobacteria bacterium]
MNKLHPLALGLSFGAVWALAVFILGLVSLWGWGTSLVSSLSSLYIGYTSTFGGACIGALWAFIDGFVGGFLVAWIYNKIITTYP